MSDQPDTDPLLDPALDSRERERLAGLARRLETERPVPRAAFRGALGRRLLRQLERHRARPGRLRILITAYAGSGLFLLAVAALGVAGAGPLAA
jgi:hypothetical protein